MTKEEARNQALFFRNRIVNLKKKLEIESYDWKHEEINEDLKNLIIQYESFILQYAELLI